MRSERGVRRKNGLKSRGIEAGEAVSRSLNSNVYALPRMGLFPNSSRKRPVDFAILLSRTNHVARHGTSSAGRRDDESGTR